MDAFPVFMYCSFMHEFSLMASVMDMVAEELARHKARRLTLLRLRYGELDSIQADSMRFAFEAMTQGTPHEGAVLEMAEDPLVLKCSLCGSSFQPESRSAMFAPCPACHGQSAFRVEKGEGIFLDHLEAE